MTCALQIDQKQFSHILSDFPLIENYADRVWCRFDVRENREIHFSQYVEGLGYPFFYSCCRLFPQIQQVLGRRGGPIFPGLVYVAVRNRDEFEMLKDSIYVHDGWYPYHIRERQELLDDLRCMRIVERFNVTHSFQFVNRITSWENQPEHAFRDKRHFERIIVWSNMRRNVEIYFKFKTIDRLLKFQMPSRVYRSLIFSGIMN